MRKQITVTLDVETSGLLHTYCREHARELVDVVNGIVHGRLSTAAIPGYDDTPEIIEDEIVEAIERRGGMPALAA